MQRSQLSLFAYLVRAELRRRHAGSVGGVVWTLVAPTTLIGVMWLALDFGLGLRSLVGPGYGIALVVGMTAWLAFSDSVLDATGVVVRNPHLVKKVLFPVELLPVASVASSFAIHLALAALVLILLLALGHFAVGLVWTLPIWIALSALLAAGMAFLVAGLNVFLRDVQAIAPFAVTVWFWLTPIVWPISAIPPDKLWLAGLNPMAIVVEGYRGALTGTSLPFDMGAVFLAFATAGAAFLIGAWLFRRLRPDFADAL
jgi:lipopolysaccharide transport system permease protein